MLRRFLVQEDGATMVEYAFMLGLIALVCVGAVQLVGTGTNSLFAPLAVPWPPPAP